MNEIHQTFPLQLCRLLIFIFRRLMEPVGGLKQVLLCTLADCVKCA